MPVLPTSRIPFDTAQLSRRGFLAAGIAGGFALAARNQSNTQAQSSAATALISTRSSSGGADVIPYSTKIDIPNPLRGQYEDLLVPEYWQGTSYAGTINYQRYGWSTFQPTSENSFSWTQCDSDIAAAAAAGKRFGMCIMAFSPEFGPDTAMPSWLTGVPGATQTSTGPKGTATFPVWNNANYLAALQNLISAVGARYDKDERLAWFEISGYGDWSELHVAAEVGDYGLVVPGPADSVAQLGYYHQYSQQIITMANITNLVGWHVAAFPNTRLVFGYVPEFCRQMLLGVNYAGQSTAAITVPAIPPGMRYDGLGYEAGSYGVWGFYPPWPASTSDYYANNDPTLVAAILSNWQKAPWIGEWVVGLGGNTVTSYVCTALNEVVNHHLSLVGCTGYDATGTMVASDYQNYLRTMMYSGYRYAATASVSGSTVTVTWTNYGVAPTYEGWQIVYQVRNSSGTSVQSVNSTYSLLAMGAAAESGWGGYVPGTQSTSTTSADPTPISGNDSFALTPLAAGSYTIWVLVNWNQHKASATTTFNAPPMSLALTGRDSTGAYQIGSFTD